MQVQLCRKVPAEDGISLATDVYLPDGPGPFPTVILRTPYHRVGWQNSAGEFTTRGYALVAQDVRGKFDSEGLFQPLLHEAADGQATIDWAANQKWCNGRVALWGRSYLGMVQLPAAAGGHEALRCIIPAVAPINLFRDWIRNDGCFALGNAVRWGLIHATCSTQPAIEHLDWEELYGLPNTDAIAEKAGFETPTLREWAEHDQEDEYWEALNQERLFRNIKVPGLHTGGWFDHISRGQVDSYKGIRDAGATSEARLGQRLVMGPWGHQTTGITGEEHCSYGDWHFGPDADFPVMAYEFQCLDFYMKDLDNGYASQAPVRIFLMGENRWLSLTDWPPPETQSQDWYLTSNGGANTRIGDGLLTREAPWDSTSDTFVYDPQDPVPTRGGPIYWGLEKHLGPVDQRPILDRPDILLYRSEKLGAPLAVVGEITLGLYVVTETVDTDFMAKLCVEEESGAITCLTLGSLRCRYRRSWADPQPMNPGEAEAIRIHLGNLAYTFPRGSRICVMITSSDFPRINAHPNTLAAPFVETKPVKTRNSVIHGPGNHSVLTLPVMES